MRKKHFVSIDALRGIAALLVMVFHFEELLYFAPPDRHPSLDALWAHYGLLGVELFFTISGFVILMSVEGAKSVAHFAVGRIARLYPAYWASVLVMGIYLFEFGDTKPSEFLV